jgi:hypothetical protein
MKLTVHLQDAPFVKRVQKNVGTKDAPIMKPKKANCIMNTITVKDLPDMKAVNDAIAHIRSKHIIGIWSKGPRAGQDMIHITHQR